MYNLQKDLVIDPYWVEFDNNLTLSSLSQNKIQVNGFKFDYEGNIIVLGQYVKGINDTDIFISKYSPDGNLIKIIYIGGTSNDNVGFFFQDNIKITGYSDSIQIDDSDNIFITGYTESTDFPVDNLFQNSSAGGTDAFLMKLNSTLNIVESRYLGGTNFDQGRSIALYNNSIFLSGATNSSNFPIKDAIQSNYSSRDFDGFIAKFDENFQLIYSSYFGGNLDDEILATAIDQQGNLVLTGETTSSNFNVTSSAIQPTMGGTGGTDAFITKLSNDGKSFIFSTYFGGEGDDVGINLVIDKNNDILVIFTTISDNFFQKYDHRYSLVNSELSFSRVIITKLDENGYRIKDYYLLGGVSYDYGLNMKLDNNSNIIITGRTESSNFWNGIKIQSNEINKHPKLFITKINVNTNTLEMSSLIQKGCYSSCVIISQDLLVDKNNTIYLLGNNQFSGTNPSYYFWTPFIEKISSQNDYKKPIILMNNYKENKNYSLGKNFTVIISDDLSGINRIYYSWNNQSSKLVHNLSIITLPEILGNNILNITAVDNAGNIQPIQFTFIIANPDYSNILVIIGTLGLSIVFAYLTVYTFWKYQLSKRKIRKERIHPYEVKDYLNLVKKDKGILNEIKDKNK